MKSLFKLIGLLLAAACLVVGAFARLAWKLFKLLAAYFAVRHIARTQIRKALT